MPLYWKNNNFIVKLKKERIIIHLDAIKADCDALAMDGKNYEDTAENDNFADFSMNEEKDE